MTEPARCVVLVPYTTHIEPACDRALRELETRGYDVRRFPSTTAVDRTRSEMATNALSDGVAELMWIDSDIVFEPASVDRLRAHGLPLVAGIYSKKGIQDFAMHPEACAPELIVGEGGGLREVKYVGAGFLLVRRAVFDDVARHFSLPVCNARFGIPSVPFFLPMIVPDGEGYWYLGEDYSFCERARQAGHAITIDSTIRLGHIGKYTYGWEDAGHAVPRVASAKFKYSR